MPAYINIFGLVRSNLRKGKHPHAPFKIASFCGGLTSGWSCAILASVTNLAQASPTPSGQGVVCHFISTDACMEAAAGSYIAALVSHDPSQVPLAPNCQRRENGTDTGDTAAAIKASMTPPTPDQVITDARRHTIFS